jgi:hypothetical protein
MRATILSIPGSWLGVAAAVMPFWFPPALKVPMAYAEAPPAPTPVEEVVMYGIDADTYELLRYTFGDDVYTRIGVVIDENGNVVEDVESLTYIPDGPNRGFYGGANYYESKPSRIVKINPMDASAVTLPAEVGYEKVEGLVPLQNPLTGEWKLLASTQHSDPGDGERTLLWIDPTTGAGTLIANTDENYDGLTLAPDGTLFGVTRDGELYTITVDPIAGTATETPIGDLSGFDAPEALEWAYGDNADEIDCTGLVPNPSWTANGILFSFSDDSDALLIVHPVTGEAVEYVCSFQTIDCEGLVFTTAARDPYGKIVVEACD